MKFKKDYIPSLAGSLLIAHPAMIDPNFRQSVVLLSAHSRQVGGVGVVVNHPAGKTMGEFDAKFGFGPLAKVPVYIGGPVQKEAIILAAWQWLENESVFKLHFGISEEQAIELLKGDSTYEIRAFLGYSEWPQGQLENEITQHAWFLSSVKNLTISQKTTRLWQKIIAKIKPELLFLVDPDDPSLN